MSNSHDMMILSRTMAYLLIVVCIAVSDPRPGCTDVRPSITHLSGDAWQENRGEFTIMGRWFRFPAGRVGENFCVSCGLKTGNGQNGSGYDKGEGVYDKGEGVYDKGGGA